VKITAAGFNPTVVDAVGSVITDIPHN
jgi:hypothetical protein